MHRKKILNIGENAPEYYEYSQREKTEEFKEKYKSRAIIEPKNAEMKRFHGLARAGGYGLVSVEKQAKLTVIAVNLKRICKLISSKKNQEIGNSFERCRRFQSLYRDLPNSG